MSKLDNDDWQEAPTECELANYDTRKIEYRQSVEKFVFSTAKKNLKKKTFITICTNVMCAEIASVRRKVGQKVVPSADIDIYLPLEICLTKWNVADSSKPIDERNFKTCFWMLNPGKPPSGCANYALDHKNKHKIEYSKIADGDNYVETDLEKIVKEINSFLLPARTIFSIELRHCRQDLGCLKWLNRAVGYKMTPIKVYSLVDLYVVLIRSLADDEETKLAICQGLAIHRMKDTSDPYDTAIQCEYHQAMARHDSEACCDCCAKAVSLCRTNILLNDVALYTNIADKKQSGE